ncbi:MAG TPA: 2-phospho-L-lactate guanylyltransferase [Actinomycetota bacterium]|nr:2-phospho-L-lactate guanylyltransferase [Actinomycetota bacterium]
MNAGILPVKELSAAKQRLAAHFDEDGRAEIARALLTDALQLCKTTAGFLNWWVISSDREVLELATAYGCHGITDNAATLNQALAYAAQVVANEGATSITIIPVDAPLTYAGDLQELVDTGETSEMVVVPSAHDGGTNALFMQPPTLMEPRFGPQSLHAHMSLASRLGYRCSVLVLPRLGLDIDTIEDVDEFLSKDKVGNSTTAQVLRRLRGEEAPV